MVSCSQEAFAMTPGLSSLFDRHAAASFDKQLFLNELVGENAWHFDMATSFLSFGKKYRWQVQLLGTESEVTRTWLWAWANPGGRVPAPSHSANLVRAVGDLQRCVQLSEPQFPVGEVDGHYLANLASGLCQARAYYRAQNQGGAVFLLIVDKEFPRWVGQSLARISTIFPQVLLSLPITDHKTAFRGYLRFYGLQGIESGNTIRVDQDSKNAITAIFDDCNRLSKLNGIIEPVSQVCSFISLAEPVRDRLQDGETKRPTVAFGPEMPGWGSWDWVGADIQKELSRHYQTVSFQGPELPECDVAVVVKQFLDMETLEKASRRASLIYCPIDAYGASAEIEADGPTLSMYARIIVHSERLKDFFAPFAPTEYMDHHVKFVSPLRQEYSATGPFLWVGVWTNLPPLVEWVNEHSLPGELLVLTNVEQPGQVPSATDFGFRPDRAVCVMEWSRELHQKAALKSRAALDIKGTDFRAANKPPAKAIDFIASGLPLAMNPESSAVEHLARMGFEVAHPLETKRWLSREYWEETLQFAPVLRELLSLERIGRRYKHLIDKVLTERRALKAL
jgi:hypothetical protein